MRASQVLRQLEGAFEKRGLVFCQYRFTQGFTIGEEDPNEISFTNSASNVSRNDLLQWRPKSVVLPISWSALSTQTLLSTLLVIDPLYLVRYLESNHLAGNHNGMTSNAVWLRLLLVKAVAPAWIIGR